MTTPLEQIKERLEKMKKEDRMIYAKTREEISERSDAKHYNSAISDIQAILPSIIQEVEDSTRKLVCGEIYHWIELADHDSAVEAFYELKKRLKPTSLKEESK